MKQLHANLLGKWVNISEKENVRIGSNNSDVARWIKEELETLYDYPTIHLFVDGVDYQIHHSQIQIVNKG